VALFREFILSILEEWKGWITGSLPMAVIAAAALIKPDLAPLPVWQWLILIFVAGLSCAIFRVYKRVRFAELSARKKLDAIAQDRPLTFVTMNLHVNQPDGRNNLWAIKRIELVFENLSDRMLEYAMSELEIELAGAKVTAPPKNRGGYIHARQQQSYGFDISHEGLCSIPLTIVFRSS
jgi:hypothetical protein